MIPPGVDIYFAVEPIDLRWGFDRLCGIVTERVGRRPRSGSVFAFFGRRRYQTTFGIQLSHRGGALPMAPAARSDAPPLPHDW